MTTHIKYNIRKTIMEVRVTGERDASIDWESMLPDIRKGMELADSNGIKGILILHNVKGTIPTQVAFDLSKRSLDLGWKPGVRLALVLKNPAQQDMAIFSEYLKHKNHDIRVFRSTWRARRWLKKG